MDRSKAQMDEILDYLKVRPFLAGIGPNYFRLVHLVLDTFKKQNSALKTHFWTCPNPIWFWRVQNQTFRDWYPWKSGLDTRYVAIEFIFQMIFNVIHAQRYTPTWITWSTIKSYTMKSKWQNLFKKESNENYSCDDF